MQEETNKDHFKRLLSRYKDGTSTPDEIKALFAFFKSAESDGLIKDDLRKEFDKVFHTQEKEKPEPAKVFRLHTITKYAMVAAASIAIIFSVYYYFSSGIKTGSDPNGIANREVIMPGGNKAVLTLDNGKKIVLDSASVGEIAVLSGTVISLDKSGELSYDATNADYDEKISINSVSTPSGGFFKIVLPDGSNVWLNSESELTFPSKFSGNERKVTLKGEGYFEVAKNKEKPFIVKLEQGENVTVLGTVFNVMSYANEPEQRVTLLEGSIDLTDSHNNKMLKPGQQAIVTNGQMDIKNDAAIDHEIAWKNGLFDFQNDDLPTIMRQISRWYNVEIVYSAANYSGHYTGSIRKSANINDVLQMLAVAGDASFSIVGKKVVVNEKIL